MRVSSCHGGSSPWLPLRKSIDRPLSLEQYYVGIRRRDIKGAWQWGQEGLGCLREVEVGDRTGIWP
jgi:hypothetical protein